MKIVKISALWCPACLITNPAFDSVIKDYNEIDVVSYDYDLDDVSNYNVGNILPVIIMFKNGIEVGRIIGEKNKKQIKDFIEGVK
ncbi:MAG: thioredoxin family protein [Firmicutes bacterium]|nr:thioredoxin family protein [Bacillota bacterium]